MEENASPNTENEVKLCLSQIAGRTVTVSTCYIGTVSVTDVQYGTVDVDGFKPEGFSTKSTIHRQYIGRITHIVLADGCNMAPASCVIVTLDDNNFVVCTTGYRNHTVEECPLVYATEGGLSRLQSLILGIMFHNDIDNDGTAKTFFAVRESKTNDNFESITNNTIKCAENDGIARTECLTARAIAVGYMRDKYDGVK